MGVTEQGVIEQMGEVNLTGLAAQDLIVDGQLHHWKPDWEKKKKRAWYILWLFIADSGNRFINGSFGWFKGADVYSFKVSSKFDACANACGENAICKGAGG